MNIETLNELGFVKIDFREITKVIGYNQMIENASHSVFMKEVFKGLFCHKDNRCLILACYWDRGHKIFVGKFDRKKKTLKKIINIDFDSNKEIICDTIQIIIKKEN